MEYDMPPNERGRLMARITGPLTETISRMAGNPVPGLGFRRELAYLLNRAVCPYQTDLPTDLTSRGLKMGLL
jgi:hypothetical protein